MEDRQYFTELIGKTTRHTQGTSKSSNANGNSDSTSYNEHADDLKRPDRDGAIVVKMAMNGVPAAHSGTLCTPLADCTKTPTKEHFNLGTRKHEQQKRIAFQRKLDIRAESHKNESTLIWCPEWPDNGGLDSLDGWEGLTFD